MGGPKRDGEMEAAARLAGRWPRGLADVARAETLAARWVRSRNAALAAGAPPHAHHALTPALRSTLFEVRRARQLVRGLEEIEIRLAAQAAGVAARSSSGGEAQGAQGDASRISRLLLVSDDGSARFIRQINQLYRLHSKTLEVLIVCTDAAGLAEGVFGAGARARALLLDHKEAVVRVLEVLDTFV